MSTNTDHLSSATSKAIRKIIPMVVLMFILAYLDRSNIGFAKQEFQLTTGLSDAAYAFGAGIFFIGYALFEVPSNILLYRIGARVWLSRIMVTWGLVSAAMMFAHDETTFIVLRFLLGVSEAGFFPGVILYLTFWFPQNIRARVTGYFLFGAPLAFIIGGPLSGSLLSLEGTSFAFGLYGWQLMFVVEGLLASIVGIWVFFYLDDRPEKAKWLTAEEKSALSAKLALEEDAKAGHSPKGALSALLDMRVLYLCLIWFTVQVCGYGIYFFLPTQIGTLLGSKVGILVGFVTAIPPLCAAIAVYYVPRISERLKERRKVAAITFMLGAAGIAVSGLFDSIPVIAIIALCVAAAGHLAMQPLYWSFPSAYLGGTAAASGIALINSVGNLGGFVAPNLRVWAEATFESARAGLYFIALVAFIGGLLILTLKRLGIEKRFED
ncbi:MULTISPECIES: MFS transporter [Providencia]|uniref:MFS transporter n=1 Tax=Providencia huaxiensis TaxID=2027290 RepID=A0ABU2J1E9_9GAMM|nr:MULTISPECIES: MFS transporter [Providencia]AXH63953.1 MFS transporter [Providencia huaxiensis]MBN6362664.1 MFS transporter [Providencia huaxiensis]MBZ3679920.1 MFS transporter [Providencia rettgeri]MCD2529308.1 MFS transporter [Providencia huaxiensis]MDT0135147.1 MFS transporter [Providencia huaxiensis]